MVKKINNYFWIITIIISLYLVFLILKPFISAILGALILTYLFSPLYKVLLRKLKNKHISSLLIILMILLIILIPSIFVFSILAEESVSIYKEISSRDFSLLISSYVDQDTSQMIKQVVDRGLFFLVQLTSDFVLSIPGIILSFFVAMFLIYFLLQTHTTISNTISNLIPFREKEKQLIVEKFKKTTSALIYGTTLAALAQGILGGLGFYLFNIPLPIFWGFVMFLLSVVPIGPAYVWIPAAIIHLVRGDTFNGIGLLIYGVLIISTIDNIIRIKIVGAKAKVNEMTILLGVLGGLKLLGIAGAIIGPLFLALVIEYIKIRGGMGEVKG